MKYNLEDNSSYALIPKTDNLYSVVLEILVYYMLYEHSVCKDVSIVNVLLNCKYYFFSNKAVGDNIIKPGRSCRCAGNRYY